MIRHGNPPHLECSSRGDARFSAFYARLRSYGNRSIEAIYQAAKVFGDGSTGLTWRQAKGRACINADEVRKLYGQLWDAYIAENPELERVLKQASGLSDMFGQPGHACQATELWRIRQRLLDRDAMADSQGVQSTAPAPRAVIRVPAPRWRSKP